MIFRGGIALIVFAVLLNRYWDSGDSLPEIGGALILAVIFTLPALMMAHVTALFISSALPRVENKIDDWVALNFRSIDSSYRQPGYFEFYTSDGLERTQRFVPHHEAQEFSHEGDDILVEVFEISTKKGWRTKVFGEGFVRFRYNIWHPENYFRENYR